MRLELVHPMLVHFPIALLSTGVVLRLIASRVAKKPAFSFLLPASWAVLFLGVITAWTTVAAGEIAEEIVAPTLENAKIMDEHSEHAYITAFGFTIGLLADGLRAFLLRKRKQGWAIKKGLAVFVWVVYLFSLGNLIITGYYGGTLVYDEGTAVLKRNR